MLIELTVRNLAVIEETRLAFAPGLNVVTGETGAGKSLLIDALQFLLGAPADRSLIRAAAPSAAVEAVFDISREPRVQQTLRNLALPFNDDYDELVLARDLHREGRAISRLNGRAAPVSALRAVGDALVDIHGQGAHLSLLSHAQQRQLLDDSAGLDNQRSATASAVAAVENARNDLRNINNASRNAEQHRDLLSFHLNEINAAQIRSGEENALAHEIDALANAETLRDACNAASNTLRDADPNADDLIGAALRILRRAQDPARVLQPLIDALDAASSQIGDAAREARAIAHNLDSNPQRLADAEERLALIRRLNRKYGGDESAVLAFADDARRQLDAINNAGQSRERAEQNLHDALRQAGGLAWSLSESRRAAAETLAANVAAQLPDVGLPNAAFSIDLQRLPDPHGLPSPRDAQQPHAEPDRYAYAAHGIDHITFLFRANPGEAMLPLAKAASGGETSRMLLALNAALHAASSIPTLVFDEIDAGVGGHTGTIIAGKLWTVGQRGQALCVTHLPQIAAYADRHFRIGKTLRGERVYAAAETLHGEERIAEIAEMLGGRSPNLIRAAQEMLQAANHAKNSP